MPGTGQKEATERFHIDETFRKKLPFKLIATNLHGAYSSPAPPDDFDPRTASPADLIKHGLLWRRPSAKDPKALSTAWEKVFNKKWMAKDRIIPQFETKVGVTHLAGKRHKAEDGSYVGAAWSGATVAGDWTGVIGFWNIPKVSEPREPQGLEGGWNSSSWIGIDGAYTSNDVLQAGIEQKVDARGNATYVAWYEWYAPAQNNSPGYIYQTNITNFPVSPGDQVYCSAQYVNSDTAGYLYFANETTGQNFPITLAPPPGATFDGESVEWIMEAPDYGEPNSALPAFTPVVFTSAIGCGPNDTFANPQNGDSWNVETDTGKVITSVTLGDYTVTIDFVG